jgi:hypothetical protein
MFSSGGRSGCESARSQPRRISPTTNVAKGSPIAGFAIRLHVTVGRSGARQPGRRPGPDRSPSRRAQRSEAIETVCGRRAYVRSRFVFRMFDRPHSGPKRGANRLLLRPAPMLGMIKPSSIRFPPGLKDEARRGVDCRRRGRLPRKTATRRYRAGRRGLAGSVSACILWWTAFGEVFDGGAVDFNPSVFRLLENRSDRRRVFWVRHGSDGNANERG